MTVEGRTGKRFDFKKPDFQHLEDGPLRGGITHTTIGDKSMDALRELMTAPLQPWEALICTSTAVKDNVTRVLQAQLG